MQHHIDPPPHCFVFVWSDESKVNKKEKMAFAMRVKVPPNSANLQEARHRTFDFFRAACRSIPSIMDIYNLYDVVNPSELRSTIAAQIRKNAHITNPKVSPNPISPLNSFLLLYISNLGKRLGKFVVLAIYLMGMFGFQNSLYGFWCFGDLE